MYIYVCIYIYTCCIHIYIYTQLCTYTDLDKDINRQIKRCVDVHGLGLRLSSSSVDDVQQSDEIQ